MNYKNHEHLFLRVVSEAFSLVLHSLVLEVIIGWYLSESKYVSYISKYIQFGRYNSNRM